MLLGRLEPFTLFGPHLCQMWPELLPPYIPRSLQAPVYTKLFRLLWATDRTPRRNTGQKEKIQRNMLGPHPRPLAFTLAQRHIQNPRGQIFSHPPPRNTLALPTGQRKRPRSAACGPPLDGTAAGRFRGFVAPAPSCDKASGFAWPQKRRNRDFQTRPLPPMERRSELGEWIVWNRMWMVWSMCGRKPNLCGNPIFRKQRSSTRLGILQASGLQLALTASGLQLALTGHSFTNLNPLQKRGLLSGKLFNLLPFLFSIWARLGPAAPKTKPKKRGFLVPAVFSQFLLVSFCCFFLPGGCRVFPPFFAGGVGRHTPREARWPRPPGARSGAGPGARPLWRRAPAATAAGPRSGPASPRDGTKIGRALRLRLGGAKFLAWRGWMGSPSSEVSAGPIRGGTFPRVEWMEWFSVLRSPGRVTVILWVKIWVTFIFSGRTNLKTQPLNQPKSQKSEGTGWLGGFFVFASWAGGYIFWIGVMRLLRGCLLLDLSVLLRQFGVICLLFVCWSNRLWVELLWLFFLQC